MALHELQASNEMSEFEKLMKAGSRRPSIQNESKKEHRHGETGDGSCLLAFFLLIPPHIELSFSRLSLGRVVVLIEGKETIHNRKTETDLKTSMLQEKQRALLSLSISANNYLVSNGGLLRDAAYPNGDAKH